MSEDLFNFDEQLRKKEGAVIAGIDEAGRGPLAGPVVASAVVLPEGTFIEGLRDSKRLNPRQREVLYERIKKTALSIGTGIVEPADIDRINIYQATIKAMLKAIKELELTPDLLVIDAMRLPVDIKQIVLKKAEDISASVAAASVIAKVTRDRIMQECHKRYPAYGFDRHKGYATREHLEALKRLGPCPVHRRSFSPVSSLKLPF
ncbi:MAG: ribonuclease HII [Nitrospirae bacterium]|nr:MAG: ribonuclease HII [Nitrospirota bacterium]